MKAAFSVIIDDQNEEQLSKIKQLYYQNASIYDDQEEENLFQESKNDVMKFMEYDYRE